ncbi:hypothetical protein [Cellvibrio sp. UBA7661]|uniref:hypothetical protein n=1 Tax=Cellvibrio sp. UBA7661 TaxID=1946311 RepID=UPI002F35507D
MCKSIIRKTPLLIVLLLSTLSTTHIHAEMNRVYHPYVEQGERELEYGFTLRDAGGENVLLNRAGFGYAWNDKLFTEVYLLTESITHDGEQIRGYEFEAKWQLTEQGEYWADWGLLFEAGTAKDINSHEFAVGLLWEKELANRWVATANAIAEYEYGSDIKDEFETALRAQFRYRYSAAIEPALEFYLDDQDWAAGPAVMGIIKLSGRKQLRWELGVLFGLDADTPENNLRGAIEFEF